MSGLYVHFPYCLYKCHYCDFNSYKTPFQHIPFDLYVQSIEKELVARRHLFNEKGKYFFPDHTEINTIFFGGGTPSLMRPSDVDQLLQLFSRFFSRHQDVEITLEANPKTLTLEKLTLLKDVGINRLSMGVQSFSEPYLSAFGRIHTADEARQAIREVSQVFSSYNVDLIFGFPKQSLSDWKNNVEEIISYGPPHLSCYAFTVEKDAPYAKMVAAGATLPDEDDQAEMMVWTSKRLQAAGYQHYETSNYCQPGFECRHNLNYWRYGPYLGLGAGAVSFLRCEKEDPWGWRTTNLKEPKNYLQALTGPKPTGFFSEEENILGRTAMAEFMMMGLRLKEGVQREVFKKLFGHSLEDVFSSPLEYCRQQGWLDDLKLTPVGEMVSNRVVAQFLD